MREETQESSLSFSDLTSTVSWSLAPEKLIVRRSDMGCGFPPAEVVQALTLTSLESEITDKGLGIIFFKALVEGSEVQEMVLSDKDPISRGGQLWRRRELKELEPGSGNCHGYLKASFFSY